MITSPEKSSFRLQRNLVVSRNIPLSDVCGQVLLPENVDAAYLSNEASRLEGRYASVLSDFLARHTTEDLPDADFFARLVKDTSDALQQWGRLPDLVFASGLLAEIDPDSAHIEAVTRDGTAIDLLLPRLLTEGRGITVGDPVLVFRRYVGHAAVVDVLPALTVKQAESGEIEMSWPKADADDDADADDAESQASEAEVAQRYELGSAARRYRTGPGALPSKTELEALIDIASTRPPRTIRLAG